VLSGEVQVWKNHGREDASLLSRYGAGRFFGEMALVDELPRSATSIAAEVTHLVYLRRDDFRDLVRRYPDVALSVMRSLSAIVRESNDSFVADLYHRNQELEQAYLDLARAQKRLIETERLSNLGKMSNMILHDIRNPVAVLNGYAAMLRRFADDPERVRDFASRIVVETERLTHLSGELLDYARGEVRLDMSVVRPSEVGNAALGYVVDRMNAAGIRSELVVVDDKPAVVDHDRMVRVVLNLLENALKASDRGDTVTLTFDRRDGLLEIRVTDTGEGMAPETSRRVFEPFFSRSESGGTGLGMVIVKSIVDAHGGSLAIESQPDEGTTVTVRVPETPAR
jgi:signal transduction histidine kinase